jgi:hypothetical protein
MLPNFPKLTGEEKDRLAASFRTAVRRAFAFLVGDYRFDLVEERRTMRYTSDKSFVNVFHESGFQLAASIGLSPSATLESDSEVDNAGYDLQDIVECFAAPDRLPPDIRLLIERGKREAYNPWFLAADPKQVEVDVERMAALTKDFAEPLLLGDRSAFRVIHDFTKRQQTKITRLMLLRNLPPDIVMSLQDKSVPEIYAFLNSPSRAKN